MPTATSHDGTRIAFTKAGRGPALIVVDGAFCYRENGMAPSLLPLLAEHFTVYWYDRRGRGESADTQPYAVEREIEDLNAVLQAAGGSAYLFGMSSGGALAIRAVVAGLPVTRLAVFEAPYIPGSAENIAYPVAANEVRRLVADGKRAEAVTYFMRRVFGAPAPFVMMMKLLMRASWKRNALVAHTLAYDLDLLGDGHVPAAAARIAIPTVIIGGEKAPPKLQAAVTRTVAAIPGAKRIALKGQSHMVKPAVLTPALVAFFNGVAAGSAHGN